LPRIAWILPTRPGAATKQQTTKDAKADETTKAPKTTTKKNRAKPQSTQRKQQDK
jgi:hypothetical protein